MKIPELQANMFQLATEMERAGLVEEVVADGMALSDVRPMRNFLSKSSFRVYPRSTAFPSFVICGASTTWRAGKMIESRNVNNAFWMQEKVT